jgi:glycosyltransferase involved in cell wall biosynthesis
VTAAGTPRVSVVIPARNEAAHLAECLASVRAALSRIGGGEVLIVDGRSTDATRSIAETASAGMPGWRLIDNPDRITSYAFNLGIAAARAPYIAIVGAHSLVGPAFFEEGCRALDADRADIVGGPVETRPGRPGLIGWLLAQVVSHPFGVGNSRFRTSTAEGYVDAVPFALFRREVFATVGTFDPAFVRNQDTDFFGRAGRAGIRVLQTPAVQSVYFARGTVAGLLSQGFRSAYWNVLVWRRNPAAFRWRHAIPGLFTIGVLGALALLALWPPAGRLLLTTIFVPYALLATLAAGHRAWQADRPLALALPPFFLSYHLAYGLGSIAGLRWLWTETR